MRNIEKQKENVSTLLTLIKENPDLEILPMVEYEVVASDDFATWAGLWGKAEIDEYYGADERIYFKARDFDELVNDECDRISDEECARMDDKQIINMAEQKVNALPWVKAIVVNIVSC